MVVDGVPLASVPSHVLAKKNKTQLFQEASRQGQQGGRQGERGQARATSLGRKSAEGEGGGGGAGGPRESGRQ